MTKSHQQSLISAGIIAAVLTLLVLAVVNSPIREIMTSPDEFRSYVRGYGILAPIIIISLHVLQVVVAPIPGQAIDIANGYLFGPMWGTLVSLVGIFLGSFLAIGLARHFGRPLVALLITPRGLASVNKYISHASQLLFFFLFLIPGTPDDLLCFAIGLSSIPFWRAVLIVLAGRAPGIITGTIIGATGSQLSPVELTLISLAFSLLIALIVWRYPIVQNLSPVRREIARIVRTTKRARKRYNTFARGSKR